jgi:sugar-phosphatase
MVKAVIFDMDGVIIDSEPLWEESEIEIFTKYGVPMTLEMCMEMKGRTTEEVVKHFHDIYQWKSKPVSYVVEELNAATQKLIIEKGEAMPGLYETLDYLKQKGYVIALASSSRMKLIQAVINKLNIEPYFQITHSAEYEPFGKPEPHVYLSAAKKINILPENCIAIEDSYLGLQSAKNAGMKTIAIPEPSIFKDKKFDIADYKFKRLDDIIQSGIL